MTRDNVFGTTGDERVDEALDRLEAAKGPGCLAQLVGVVLVAFLLLLAVLFALGWFNGDDGDETLQARDRVPLETQPSPTVLDASDASTRAAPSSDAVVAEPTSSEQVERSNAVAPTDPADDPLCQLFDDYQQAFQDMMATGLEPGSPELVQAEHLRNLGFFTAAAEVARPEAQPAFEEMADHYTALGELLAQYDWDTTSEAYFLEVLANPDASVPTIPHAANTAWQAEVTDRCGIEFGIEPG